MCVCVRRVIYVYNHVYVYIYIYSFVCVRVHLFIYCPILSLGNAHNSPAPCFTADGCQ